MNIALQLAEKAANAAEVPVGAVIIREDEIIGKGFNCPISTNDPTAHAEIIAIRNAASNSGNYRLNETTLYVTVEPCAMCAAAISNARIKQVVYGCEEPKSGALVSSGKILEGNMLGWKFSHRGGVLADEARELMQSFFAARRP